VSLNEKVVLASALSVWDNASEKDFEDMEKHPSCIAILPIPSYQ